MDYWLAIDSECIIDTFLIAVDGLLMDNWLLWIIDRVLMFYYFLDYWKSIDGLLEDYWWIID